MAVQLTDEERAGLVAAAKAARDVRRWRRFQAVMLLGDGQSPATVAGAVGVTAASVYRWQTRWHTEGIAGLTEATHRGPLHRLDPAADARLNAWLETDPIEHGFRTVGWTVALLQTQLARHGDAVSDPTIRRTLHRLGWRWKRPKYLLGRPDPAYAATKGRSRSRQP